MVVVTTTMLFIMTQIAEIDDVWEYMNNTVLGTLYAISNTTAANGAMLVLGSLRIHQIRQTSVNGTNPCCAYCSVGVSLCVCAWLYVVLFGPFFLSVWSFLLFDPFCSFLLFLCLVLLSFLPFQLSFLPSFHFFSPSFLFVWPFLRFFVWPFLRCCLVLSSFLFGPSFLLGPFFVSVWSFLLFDLFCLVLRCCLVLSSFLFCPSFLFAPFFSLLLCVCVCVCVCLVFYPIIP